MPNFAFVGLTVFEISMTKVCLDKNVNMVTMLVFCTPSEEPSDIQSVVLVVSGVATKIWARGTPTGSEAYGGASAMSGRAGTIRLMLKSYET